MVHPPLRRSLCFLAALFVLAGCGSPVGPTPASPSWYAGTTPTPTPVATPTAAPTPLPQVPLVAVAGFRSELAGTGMDQLRAILAGSDPAYKALELVGADAGPVLAALGLPSPTENGHIVLSSGADELAADLGRHADRLGVLRASQVGPNVRALDWEGASLFGTARLHGIGEWPLKAPLGADTFDPGSLWTVAAGGDVMLDRGVYKTVVVDRKGIDFPWNGGSATITGRRCCSAFDWPYPLARRTSSEPLVKQVLSRADLAMVNLEGPAPVNATYHTGGMAFTFSQALLGGMTGAGIDVVSLANNHIGNAGSKGVRETLAALDSIGIAHTGAGGTRAAGATPAMFTVAGVRVAVIGVSAFGYSLAATLAGAPAEIAAARAAGAQVVIVYPHWGREYKSAATDSQRTWGRRLIDAGADMVIGNHAHWVAGMEIYRGKPIWYALGNFVFDQSWSEQTEEGLLLELTFDGTRLVQARMHPLLIMDNAQPNFLDTVSGRVVLNQLYRGSGKYLPW